MIATSAVAQVNTNKLPEIPPPATTAAPAAPLAAPLVAAAETKTNAPAKKAAAKKKTATKAKAAPKAAVKTAAKSEKKLPEAPVTLVAGPATVTAEHVNLRGQAGLKGEVVGHAQKGDLVTVISEISLDKPKAGEPAQWAKIALPAGTKVWVDSKFIDPSNNVVSAKKLNMRGGPGENYSVLGVIEKGASITAVTTKGDWTQIETPSSACAFVAAGYLKQEGTPAVPAVETNPLVATTPPAPPPQPVVPPTPTTVTEQPAIAPPTAVPPTTPETSAPPTPVIATTTPTPSLIMPTPTPTLAPEDTGADTNLPPRIVTHEGSVRSSVSPVAPTKFELYDPTDGKAINYLYSPTTNLNLARYDGLHVTVNGEEGLDPRWKDTPVIAIQQIYVLSGTPKPGPAQLKPVKSDTTAASATGSSPKHRKWYHLWLW